VTDIARNHGKTTAQILLKFLVEEDIVVLPKSSSSKRIQENIDVILNILGG